MVAEYAVSPENVNLAVKGSEEILLSFRQPFSNHNGGMLAFGPDGFLHIGTGDGGSGGDPQGNGQNLETLLGKILRIDVDSGSPFARTLRTTRSWESLAAMRSGPTACAILGVFRSTG